MRLLAAALLLTGLSGSAEAGHCTEGSYTNVSGHRIHDPECVDHHVQGETAICRDGSHSLSEHRQGTCSHHGGVDHFE